jgi:hypothetical protein
MVRFARERRWRIMLDIEASIQRSTRAAHGHASQNAQPVPICVVSFMICVTGTRCSKASIR